MESTRGSRVEEAVGYPGSVVRHPRTPYLVLGGMQALAAVSTLAFVVIGPREATLWKVDVVALILLVGLTVFTLAIAPRTRLGWGLGASLTLTELVALIGLTQVEDAEGQMTVALGLVMFGAFAGYFRPKPWLYAHVALLAGGFALNQLVDPHLSGPVPVGVACAVIIGVTLMVSALADHLRTLALHDSLTGVYNRRGLDLVATQVGATASRASSVVTVGLIDLDDFKAYNDARGHLAGDERLASVAMAWSSHLRGSDVIARFGGDEFALVLAGTTPAECDDLVARVRESSRGGWSIGLAVWIPGEDLYTALARADEALFDAKRQRTTSVED